MVQPETFLCTRGESCREVQSITLSHYNLEPEGDYAEEIRKVRSFLLHRVGKQGRKSLLVTSCWPGEGKTRLCLNLAAALGEFGYRVLLVDADVKGQTLSRVLLSGRQWRNFESVAVETGMDGMQMDTVNFEPSATTQLGLERGSFEPVATNLAGVDLVSSWAGEFEERSLVLTSPAFRNSIESALPKYDVVLTDAPSLSAHKEAVYSCFWGQACLMVVDPQRLQGATEGHMVEDLRDRGVEVVGCVISAGSRV